MEERDKTCTNNFSCPWLSWLRYLEKELGFQMQNPRNYPKIIEPPCQHCKHYKIEE